MEQLVRGEVQDSAPKAAKVKNPKPGRPKGSVNQNRKDVELSPFQTQLQGCIRAALKLTGLDLGIVYFVYDGALGNNAGLQAVNRAGLRLISKLRHDSKLYLPYAGAYSGKGKPRKYGERLAPETLTEAHLKTEAVEKGIRTRIYQARAWHKHFPALLNVAVIVKTNLKTAAILILAVSPGFWLRRSRVEALQHEIHQRLPSLKTQVTGQGTDVIEQAFS
jgi:putative transposase